MTGAVEGLVSVVLPVHDRPRLLAEAVDSVRAQTYPKWELIVVDDASSDDTPRVAADLATASPEKIHVVRLDVNRGPGAAREIGRLRARGEFLQFLDSDDLLLPHKFERQIGGLRRHTEAGASYGWTRAREEDGSALPSPVRRTGEALDRMFPAFLAGRIWGTLTPLWRASVCERAGGWSDLRQEEDWEFDCRIAALGTRLHYLPEWVCEIRTHSGSRAGHGDPLEPWRLRERHRAHRQIFEHALRAGVPPEAPEMHHLSRALFLLSRQCGLAGLPAEAASLFVLARRSATPGRARGLDFKLYAALAGILGWRRAAGLATWADGVRGRARARRKLEDGG